MSRPFTFQVVEASGSTRRLDLDVSRVYNLGFTIRDAQKMQAHLEEVYKHGLSELKIERPPIIFPISAWATITDDEAPVQYGRTSGEVEIATIDDGDGELYVTVASDITDRQLEVSNLEGARNIRWSKQVAPNVVAPTVWRWQDVEAHWDEVTIHSTIIDGDRTVEYQRAGVSEFWTPAEMRASIDGRVVPVPGAKILLSGTVVSLDEELNFGRTFIMSLRDPVLGRTIEHTYRTVVLSEEVSD